jgi:hypothetical protein
MFDVAKARCRIRIFREGVLAAVGHDLLLEVKDFRISIREDLSVEAECRTASIEVLGAVKNGELDPRALSAKDLADIERDMLKKVLEVDRFPTAKLRSTSVTESAGRYRIAGLLSLHGTERRVEASGEKTAKEAIAKLTVNQPSFGITPFRVMLGALKIKPEVIVEVTVPIA